MRSVRRPPAQVQGGRPDLAIGDGEALVEPWSIDARVQPAVPP
jgi:hypothetical protein